MNFALQSALTHFDVRGDELFVAGKAITDIARQVGTPLYLYDRSVLRWRHALLREKLPAAVKIYYAVKANPSLNILQEIAGLYDGADVASGGELERALAAGISAQNLSFAGPGKSITELALAIGHDIGAISVEAERELDHIEAICAQMAKPARIQIRVNPAFELARSGMKMGGGPKQFGIDSERVPQVLQRLGQSRWLQFAGLHIYSGSQNLDASAIGATFRQIIDYTIALANEQRIAIPSLNLGGGFGIPYFANDLDLDLDAIGADLTQMVAGARSALPETQFKIELGRFIVGECGLYLATIRYRKQSRGETFLVLDGGMHHHLAASGNFGQSLVRRPMALTVANKLTQSLEKVNVVGPLCTPIDTFGMGLELPRSEEGDWVAVMNSGAYGYSASPLGFLSHPPPVEVLL